MNSKEALDNLRFDVLMLHNIDYIRSNNECDIIEKDLERLEILRKHSTRLDDEDWNSNIFNGIDYENLDEKERKVIKEWLENE